MRGIYEDWFGVKSARTVFSTFKGEIRREYMRRKIREVLRDEPGLLSRFVVTAASSPPDPYHLWLEKCWYLPLDGQPVALLGGN